VPELLADAGTSVGSGTIVKLDCEGGERVLIDDARCIDILGSSMSFVMETHHGVLNQNIGYPVDRWKQWFQSEFGTKYPWRVHEFIPLSDPISKKGFSPDLAIFNSYVK